MSWNLVKIGDIVEPKVPQGGPPKNSEFTYIDISSIENSSKQIVAPKLLKGSEAPSRAKQNVKTHDVLVSMTRPNLNAVAIVPEELDGSVASTGFDVLRSTKAHPRFLFYRVISLAFVEEMCSKVQGALYPAVRPKDIREHCVPFPDFKTQQALANKIDRLFSEIDAGIIHVVQTTRKLELYKQSVLNAAILGRLVPQDPNDEPASLLIQRIRAEKEKLIQAGKFKKEKPLPPIDPAEVPFELPRGWEWTRLGCLSRGMVYGTSQKCDYDIPGTAVLRIPNVAGGRVSFDDLKYTNLSANDLRDLSLQKGDMLVIRSNGSVNLVGRSAVFEGNEIDVAFAGYLIRFRPISAEVDSNWIHFCFESPYLRAQIEEKAKSTSGVNNISAKELAELLIPVPPAKTGTRLVSSLSDTLNLIRDLVLELNEKASSANSLKQSILKSAFEGHLI